MMAKRLTYNRNKFLVCARRVINNKVLALSLLTAKQSSQCKITQIPKSCETYTVCISCPECTVLCDCHTVYRVLLHGLWHGLCLPAVCCQLNHWFGILSKHVVLVNLCPVSWVRSHILNLPFPKFQPSWQRWRWI